jgi:hypothetical protein
MFQKSERLERKSPYKGRQNAKMAKNDEIHKN